MAELSRCATCQHWDQSDLPLHGYRECGYGACLAVGGAASYTPVGEMRMFIYWDSWQEPPLLTRADFGCVLHEPKEAMP